MHEQYSVTVDVAAEPDEAVAAVRELLWPKAHVEPMMRIGPAGGNPTVEVRLQGKRMARFLIDFYQETDLDWLRSLTVPPLPNSAFRGQKHA